ncbi:MAG: hypothetical protein MI725_07745 [Pirellulales bacterium]|nr:hypothetical protein [Pirellulales bacterium]
MNLRWKVSFSGSCLHTATCLQEGLPIADAKLAAQSPGPVSALVAELEACGLDAGKILPLLTGLAAEYENNSLLVEMAITRVQGAGSIGSAAMGRLAGRIADLESMLLRARPRLIDELEVRSRPLREQWEARGPGLLQYLAKLTDDEFIAPAAEVVLVDPIVGGHGRAHLTLNRVTFEAVLANPHPELPEAVRLGWLLAQLNIDLPRFSDLISGKQRARIASLATLPLVLSAAEWVEWAVLSEASLSQALTHWYLPTDLPDDAPQRLLGWWQTYAAGKTRWPIALAALGELLEA